MTSPSSTNREKFEKIGRSDRLLHPEDRKKQSLIRLFSNWDKKKKHTHKKTVTDQTATCFPFWEIWLVNLKYTWSCCHCILSNCLQVSTYLKSLVSFIFADLSRSKWKCYVIWHIQKKENCQDNCPSGLSSRLSCQWLFTLWKNQYTKSVMDKSVYVFHAF